MLLDVRVGPGPHRFPFAWRLPKGRIGRGPTSSSNSVHEMHGIIARLMAPGRLPGTYGAESHCRRAVACEEKEGRAKILPLPREEPDWLV
jgi:hypothetical protein